jgi:hypothetical protein
MTNNRELERDAIRAAAERLLAGTPTRSTGALTVVQLAAEAGVKRWVLTHKHPDLRQEFEAARNALSGIPTAFQPLHARTADLEAANKRPRDENAELNERVNTYAQVIQALTTELTEFRRQQPTTVRHLPAARTTVTQLPKSRFRAEGDRPDAGPTDRWRGR